MTDRPEWPEGFDHTDFSEAAMEARSKYFEQWRAWRKAQERNYPHPGLDVPWWTEDPPAKVWEAAPGIPGAIAAGGITGFNGYVLLPPEHPWRDVDLQGWEENPKVPFPDVHGGITFGPHITGWIGFDTGHAWDHWDWDYLEQQFFAGKVPGSMWERWVQHKRIEDEVNARMGLEPGHHPGHGETKWDKHWTLEALEREVEHLALQAHLLDKRRTAHHERSIPHARATGRTEEGPTEGTAT